MILTKVFFNFKEDFLFIMAALDAFFLGGGGGGGGGWRALFTYAIYINFGVFYI